MADDVTPLTGEREKERETGLYGVPDIVYTVPSLSWVVAMAHRDYAIHRGIYLRYRQQLLDTSDLSDYFLTHELLRHLV